MLIDNLNNNANNTNNRFFNCDRYMLLKICVSADGANDDIKNKYLNASIEHNLKMSSNLFYDAGFDLFTVDKLDCFIDEVNKVNFKIKCSATMVCESGKVYPTGFHIYPRSSTGSKTPLRLANSVGIIDSGYRGDLMAMFDCIDCDDDIIENSKNSKNSKKTQKKTTCDYRISKHSKLVQICAPGLVPIYVEVVDVLNVETARGSGGFGSTGV